MVSALVTVAVIAWCAQLALGYWQISRFNNAFDRLCQQGRVGVGRSGGRFKPRVVSPSLSMIISESPIRCL